MASLNLLCFGDQSVQAHESIKTLCAKTRESVILAEFLRSSHQALMAAVSDLTALEKAAFASRDFVELCTLDRRKGARNAAVSSVLSCVAQIGWALV